MKTYEASPGEDINTTAKNMVAMAKQFGCVVTSEFNEIPLDAMPSSIPADIAAGYMAEMKRRSDEYHASPEYAESQRKAKEAQEIREAALRGALAVAPATLSLVDPKRWQDWLAQQSDEYGQAIFRYADKWARLMEARMSRGDTLEACAEDASRLADDEGITGFMYGAAVSTLAQCWIHGEQLRRWHNLKTQIRGEGVKANESGGVLNPALLTIG